MSGRGSIKLAEKLSFGASDEFERVLTTLARVVGDAAVKQRETLRKSARVKRKRNEPEAALDHQALLDELRKQVERA